MPGVPTGVVPSAALGVFAPAHPASSEEYGGSWWNREESNPYTTVN